MGSTIRSDSRPRDSPEGAGSESSRGARAWWLAPLGLLGSWLLRLLSWTWRYEVVGGGATVEGLQGGGGPVVLTVWHNRTVACVGYFWRRLHRSGLPLVVMVSSSRDGGVATSMILALKVPVVRGSSSRRGSAALLAALKTVRREGRSPIIVTDGPRGPIYRCQPGAVLLAQLSGVPLVAASFAASRRWTINSWDHLMIPRPFARVAVAVSEPLAPPRERSPEALKAARLELEAKLADLTREAEQAVGQEPILGRAGSGPARAAPAD